VAFFFCFMGEDKDLLYLPNLFDIDFKSKNTKNSGHITLEQAIDSRISYGCANYIRFLLFWLRERVFLWDVEGRNTSNFYRLFCCQSGHCHPRIKGALSLKNRFFDLTFSSFY